MIYVCLCYNFVSIQKQLIGIASLINEMSGESASIIYSTHCINKTILCPINFIINHISEEVLNTFARQTKICVDPVLHRPSEKIHFPVELQVISNIYLFVS
jgi:hypothetical protein